MKGSDIAPVPRIFILRRVSLPGKGSGLGAARNVRFIGIPCIVHRPTMYCSRSLYSSSHFPALGHTKKDAATGTVFPYRVLISDHR